MFYRTYVKLQTFLQKILEQKFYRTAFIAFTHCKIQRYLINCNPVIITMMAYSITDKITKNVDLEILMKCIKRQKLGAILNA